MSKEITFNWRSLVPECPTLEYIIVASNCGKCPTLTDNNTVTCTDVPNSGNVLCTFAIQTVVCGDIIGKLSETIQVILKDSNQNLDCHGEYTCTGAIISAVLFGGIGVCASIFTVVYVAITKRLKRAGINTQSESTGQQYEDVNLQQSSLEPDTINTSKNAAYGPSTLDTKKNVAYGQVHVQQLTTKTSD